MFYANRNTLRLLAVGAKKTPIFGEYCSALSKLAELKIRTEICPNLLLYPLFINFAQQVYSNHLIRKIKISPKSSDNPI